MSDRAGHDEVLSDRQLSGREWEIAHLVASGLSNPRIAEDLCISSATVHNHLDHIYKKLGVHGRVKLALWFASHETGLASVENEPTGP